MYFAHKLNILTYFLMSLYIHLHMYVCMSIKVILPIINIIFSPSFLNSYLHFVCII